VTPTTIRRAVPTDFPRLAELRWMWSVDENGRPSPFSRDEFAREFAEWASQHAGTHTCFVAERDGAVVGMAWLAVTARVPAPRSVERRTGDVQSVYVVPSLRNQGIGSELVAAVKREAAELGLERLVVHSSPGAVSAYDRAGFVSSELLRDLSFVQY
jgi:GNAT superfamily N-acetyltransferase